MQELELTGMEIAVVGLAGRFPGAENIEQYWENIRDGVESISFFSKEEVLAAGANEALVANPNYVRARGILGNVDKFDATFFGYSPKEAALMDPQHRIFLETAWQGLEDAGYCSKYYDGKIGVYASVGFNSYLVLNMEVAPDFIHAEHGPQAMLGNDKDFLASRVSYKLQLTGPSVIVQSACSSSLVAIHQACQSLLSGEADMQLAGGITIRVPEINGNLYQEGMINSPDGHCRAFDKDAAGTVAGNGVGIVVLKRLEDALNDRDHIYGVIKASAINNDGDDKVGYAAPSPGGQAKVIQEAQSLADVDIESIGYVEAHGSGTKMGDPIEIEALKNAFTKQTKRKNFCSVGSVKANIGHLDAAAGIAGFIKAVLALHHKKIPPSVNFNEPNPLCEFEDSPFYVNTECLDWPLEKDKRRAGVSSFGMGGTNAHIVLEEAPEPTESGISRDWQLVTVSAKTASALDRVKENLRSDLQKYETTPLADLAYTLHKGRHQFPHSTLVLAKNCSEALEAISQGHNDNYFNAVWDETERELTFMFSGQGSQHVNMARELYEREADFKKDMDYCTSVLNTWLDVPLTEVIFSDEDNLEKAKELLNQTAYTQPALFVVEYCIAQQLIRWGIQPEAMIGHSIGEYVAATLAGVFTLDDALAIVAKRGALIQSLPTGDMLFIPKAEEFVTPYLSDTLSLAVINTPESTVVSGEKSAIADLQKVLEEASIKTKILRTSHAFHSYMMEPILEEFKASFSSITLSTPSIPFISNVTADWITPEQACDPQYWASHLRGTVQFAKGIEKLSKGATRLFIEVGPGNSLTQFGRSTLGPKSPFKFLQTQASSMENVDAQFALLRAVGRIWQFNFQVDWSAYYEGQVRNRLSLSGYPFQGESYWVDFKNKKNSIKDERAREELLWAYSWEKVQTYVSNETLSSHALLFAGKESNSIQQLLTSTYENLSTIIVDTKAFEQSVAELTTQQELSAGEALDIYVQLDEQQDGYDFICLIRSILNVISQTGTKIKLTYLGRSGYEVIGDEKILPSFMQNTEILKTASNLSPNFRWQIIDLGSNEDQAEKVLKPSHLTFSENRVMAVRRQKLWSRILKAYSTDSQATLNEAETYVCLGNPNEFSMQLIQNWSAQHQAQYVFVAPDIRPVSEWSYLQQKGNKLYDQLLSMQKEGININAIACPLTDTKAMADLIADYAKSSRVAVIDMESLSDDSNMVDFFALTKEQFDFVNQSSLHKTQMLIDLKQNGTIDWFTNLSFQSSFMGYPDRLKELFMDTTSSAALADQSESLIYVNNDFFDANLHQDWMQRADYDQRVLELKKAIATHTASPSLWLNPTVPQNYVWQGQIADSTTSSVEGEEDATASGLYKRPDLSVPYAAPITERQKIICSIWQDMFQIDRVGIHDDFFDLGGDSVMALKLLSALELAFDVALPLSEVINSPNVAAQANAIVEYTEVPMDKREINPVVTLQGKGEKPPFFCVHPAGGIIHCYIEMAKILGKDQPFYAFQHPGIDGKSGPYVTYPKMAELYIESMLKIQPEGPYFIGGWSFGGTVAYEMAMQLRGMGKEVAMVALFDSPGPSSLYRLKGRPEFEFSGMLAFLSQALGTMFGAEIQVSVDEMRKIPPEQQLDYILDRAVEVSGDSELGSAKEALERIVDIFEVCDRGEREYEPEKCSDDLYMYRVQDLDDYEFTGYKEHPQLESATFGWDELCQAEVKVRFVPGTHISMIFPPNVQILTEKFKADLDQKILDVVEKQNNSSAKTSVETIEGEIA